MNNDSTSTRPVRKQLDHSIHYHARFGATYFIHDLLPAAWGETTCKPDVVRLLFEAAQHYHASEEWYLELLLLMPDHIHLLWRFVEPRIFRN
jgi:hypothetical protein